MNIGDFLKEFDEDYFPSNDAPWINFDDHEPPFPIKYLRKIEKSGYVDLDEKNRRYRLTWKATKEGGQSEQD